MKVLRPVLKNMNKDSRNINIHINKTEQTKFVHNFISFQWLYLKSLKCSKTWVNVRIHPWKWRILSIFKKALIGSASLTSIRFRKNKNELTARSKDTSTNDFPTVLLDALFYSYIKQLEIFHSSYKVLKIHF